MLKSLGWSMHWDTMYNSACLPIHYRLLSSSLLERSMANPAPSVRHLWRCCRYLVSLSTAHSFVFVLGHVTMFYVLPLSLSGSQYSKYRHWILHHILLCSTCSTDSLFPCRRPCPTLVPYHDQPTSQYSHFECKRSSEDSRQEDVVAAEETTAAVSIRSLGA